MLQAVIFDMDGVIIDSEPMWQLAEAQVFAQYGLDITPVLSQQTRGWRTDAVAQYWFERCDPDHVTHTSPEFIEQQLVAQVIHMIREQGQLLPGLRAAIDLALCHQLKIGLATSSPVQLMETVLEKFELASLFHATCSAEFLPYGKPHPQVYLNAAQALQVDPTCCLAIEDSIVGMTAAKAAQMKCLVVPEVAHQDDPRYALADIQLNNLTELTTSHLELK